MRLGLTRLGPFPSLIDPSGFWIRPEHSEFIVSLAPGEDPDEPPLEAVTLDLTPLSYGSWSDGRCGS
jgi:hypothetical protein